MDKQDGGLKAGEINEAVKVSNSKDGQDGELKHGEITRAVIGSAFEVMKELGAGFLESVYEKAMLLVLRKNGLSVIAQHPIKVMFRGETVGEFYADLFVENTVISGTESRQGHCPRAPGPGDQLPERHWHRGRAAHQLRQPQTRIQTLHQSKE